MSAEPLPLEGIRIVDFTVYWGPLPTAIMVYPAKVYELSPPFNATNRNKLGLTLDLARPDGVYPLGTRCKTCKTAS